MEETIEHLFRYVEEKIVGLEMLLKHGKGYSKSYDQQLFKPVDFYVIDYEIYKYNADSVKKHTSYLLGKYYALFNNDNKITKLASLDEVALDFSTIPEVANNLKNDLNIIINKLLDYIGLISNRQNATDETNKKLKVSVIEYLITLEINDEPMFNIESSLVRNQIKDSLAQFINKNLEEIRPILNFHTPNRKEYFANYIISRLAELSGILYVDIKNISINGKPYDEDNGVTQRNRYNKKIYKKTYTKEFEKFYTSFEEGIKGHLA
jgi:hypothetical protein